MAPPEHFLIGITLANIFYSFQSFFKERLFTYLKLVSILALIAIFPDIDSFFGKYTSTNPLIGHRGITHSLLGIGVIALLFTILSSVISISIRIITGYWYTILKYFKGTNLELKENIDFNIKKHILKPLLPKYFIIFFILSFIAGLSHLIADLPQPPGVWNGIPLFYPLQNSSGEYIRNGGWSFMGWYDIKVIWILLGTVAVSIPMVMATQFIKLIKFKIISIILFAIIIIFNIGSFYYISSYISSCTYKSRRDWAIYQTKVIDDLPVKLKDKTILWKKIGFDLFRQVRRYK
jgi:membrane-bound metal-dependent hydrolase YbcI (DUF457 family)